jgi:hypothetical protein
LNWKTTGIIPIFRQRFQSSPLDSLLEVWYNYVIKGEIMKNEYKTLYIPSNTKEADDVLLDFSNDGWKVVCSCATNRLILVKETDELLETFLMAEKAMEEQGKTVPLDPTMFSEMTKEEQIKFYIDILENDATHGTEEGHILADDTLCQLLTSLGYGRVAEKFETLKKWYS